MRAWGGWAGACGWSGGQGPCVRSAMSRDQGAVCTMLNHNSHTKTRPPKVSVSKTLPGYSPSPLKSSPAENSYVSSWRPSKPAAAQGGWRGTTVHSPLRAVPSQPAGGGRVCPQPSVRNYPEPANQH